MRVATVPIGTPRPDIAKLIGTTPSAIEEYRSGDGHLKGYIARIDSPNGKSFRPITPWRNAAGQLSWRLRGFAQPLPIYGHDRLLSRPDAPVLAVEGEKAAKAAQSLFSDHIAITWPGGASSAGKADWNALKGRDVVLWPDADEPGRKAMDEVATALAAAGCGRLRLVNLPANLPKGWDVADEPPPDLDLLDVLRKAPEVDPTLARFFLQAGQLLALPIPVQEFMVGRFMPTRSLSMVFAERGIGKTWFCMTLALAVARGEPFFAYDVPKARRVLYIDGEMALSELQARQRALDPDPPDFLEFLPSELLYREDKPLNLHEEEDQKRVLAALARREAQGRSPELIVIDNLSSLARGVDENSNSDLDKLLYFLIGLRHRGYSILLVHHAGKNKTQRGASRREDMLNLSIELRRPDKTKDPKYKNVDASVSADGAHFILEFSKVRGRHPKPNKLDLKLREVASGRVEWLRDDAPHATQEDRILRYVLEAAPETQREIAEEFKLTAGRISQLCKAMRDQGHLVVGKGNRLAVSVTGSQRIVAIWPEMSDRVTWQNDFLP